MSAFSFKEAFLLTALNGPDQRGRFIGHKKGEYDMEIASADFISRTFAKDGMGRAGDSISPAHFETEN